MTSAGDTRMAIDVANQNFMTNFGNRDSAGLASLCTSIWQWLPANSDVVSGQPRVGDA